jgi:hypothetical protein
MNYFRRKGTKNIRIVSVFYLKNDWINGFALSGVSQRFGRVWLATILPNPVLCGRPIFIFIIDHIFVITHIYGQI